MINSPSPPSTIVGIIRSAGLLAVCLGAGVFPSRGAQQDPAEPTAQQPPAQVAPGASKVDSALLLSNPVPLHEDFKYLYMRRSWLAGRAESHENFELVATEFAGRGAFFSGIELLWFADKLIDDEQHKAVYQTTMRSWMDQAEPANQMVEEGLQMIAANRRQEGMDRLYETVRQFPYSEKAHYELANANFLAYLKADEQQDGDVPISLREKIFRMAYEQLQYTIAIDPIFYDAHYLLQNIRQVIHDDPQFLLDTQHLTHRALTFRNVIFGPMGRIENGGREPELFDQLGAGFDEVGLLDYAVFAYQIAIARGSTDEQTAERLKLLVETYFSSQ